MVDSGNNHKSIILMVDVESQRYHRFISLLEEGVEDGVVVGFYLLTVNGIPVHHTDKHLQRENNLGIAISAIQTADVDPQTGVEYGELT